MTKQEINTWKQYLKNFRLDGCGKCPYAANERGRCEYGPFFCDKDRREVAKIRKELTTNATLDELMERLHKCGIYDYDTIADAHRK